MIVTARKPRPRKPGAVIAPAAITSAIVGRPIVPIDYAELGRRAEKAEEVWRELVRRASLPEAEQ